MTSRETQEFNTPQSGLEDEETKQFKDQLQTLTDKANAKQLVVILQFVLGDMKAHIASGRESLEECIGQLLGIGFVHPQWLHDYKHMVSKEIQSAINLLHVHWWKKDADIRGLSKKRPMEICDGHKSTTE